LLPDYESVEDFEEGWNNNQYYLFDGSTIATAAQYDTTPEDYEDFEEEWNSNENYLFDGSTITTAASYDTTTPEDVEDFEEEWNDNENFLFDGSTITTAAVYGTDPPQNFDDFNKVLGEFDFTVNTTTDRIVKAGHGVGNDETITFRNENGILPDGLLGPDVTYYVVNRTSNDFQVAQTMGGTPLSISDDGYGTHYAIPDPAVWWTDIMTTI